MWNIKIIALNIKRRYKQHNNNNNELYLHDHTSTYSIAKAMLRNQNYNTGQLRYVDNNLSRTSKQANLRSGPIWAVLIHFLLRLTLKLGSLFVSPCPPECYLQSETKIEPALRLKQAEIYFMNCTKRGTNGQTPGRLKHILIVGFRKLVSLTVFQSSFLLFVTFYTVNLRLSISLTRSCDFVVYK